MRFCTVNETKLTIAKKIIAFAASILLYLLLCMASLAQLSFTYRSFRHINYEVIDDGWRKSIQEFL